MVAVAEPVGDGSLTELQQEPLAARRQAVLPRLLGVVTQQMARAAGARAAVTRAAVARATMARSTVAVSMSTRRSPRPVVSRVPRQNLQPVVPCLAR